MSLLPRDLERLAAYIDDALPPDQRAEFEAQLRSSAALQEELEIQTKLDASLNRLFEYRPPQAGPLPIAPHRRNALLRWASIAAVLVLAGVGLWYALRRDPLLISPEQVWSNMVAIDFKPVWRCENDDQFRKLLTMKLGDAFTIDESKGVHVVGWGYGQDYRQYPLSKDTLILINKVGEDHSLILIDRADNARRLRVSPSTGLHLYQREVGALVLYELTPRDQPDVLNAVQK